ncbi:hypothetical protein ACOXXE_17200 [Pseudomonas mediterranea]
MPKALAVQLLEQGDTNQSYLSGANRRRYTLLRNHDAGSAEMRE